jgi:hypothetical protein
MNNAQRFMRKKSAMYVSLKIVLLLFASIYPKAAISNDIVEAKCIAAQERYGNYVRQSFITERRAAVLKLTGVPTYYHGEQLLDLSVEFFGIFKCIEAGQTAGFARGNAVEFYRRGTISRAEKDSIVASSYFMQKLAGQARMGKLQVKDLPNCRNCKTDIRIMSDNIQDNKRYCVTIRNVNAVERERLALMNQVVEAYFGRPPVTCQSQ